MIFFAASEIMIGNNFRVGVAPYPNSDVSPDIFINVWPVDTYMMARDCKNPEGAWYYLMWYNKTGIVMVAENYLFQLDPSTYFPRFMTNAYTRERVVDVYYDELEIETKENIKIRDNMFMNMRLTYNFEPVLRQELEDIYSQGIMPMIYEPEKYGDVRGRLKVLQRQADQAYERWLDDKILAGWQFSADHPWGISPMAQAD